MASQPKPVRIEEVDWQAILPWLVLFRSFRMAMQPTKLALALVMVLLGYGGGMVLDAVSGETTSMVGTSINTAALTSYGIQPRVGYTYPHREVGVFAAAMEFKFDALGRMARAAVRLDFGFGDMFRPRHQRQRDTVLAAMYGLVVILPSWFIRNHPGLLCIYSLWAVVLWAYFGGAISRLAALDAGSTEHVGIRNATSFAKSRFIRFVLTLVLPGVVAAVAGGVLIAAGFLISWPILNVLVGAAFPLVLLAGLLFAMIVILLIASSTLLYPAIAVEDADPFDAISRAFGYVIGRPWRWIFYNTVALVYGALTYLVMTFVVFLSIAAVYYCMRIGAMDKGDFNAILPPPNADQLFYKPDWSGSEGTAAFTAILVWGWVSLMISLLAAYAVSFGISASTWVYLLLRRSADGNELSDIYTIEVPASESEE